jgi:hypothetical protein
LQELLLAFYAPTRFAYIILYLLLIGLFKRFTIGWDLGCGFVVNLPLGVSKPMTFRNVIFQSVGEEEGVRTASHPSGMLRDRPHTPAPSLTEMLLRNHFII